MRLNYILQDLFRDTLLDHIWSAQICIFGKITLRLKSEKKILETAYYIACYFSDRYIWLIYSHGPYYAIIGAILPEISGYMVS